MPRNSPAMIVLMMVLGLSLSARPAIACGSCEEDDRASVYDHALMSKAMANPQRLEFLVIKVVGAWTDAAARAVTQFLQHRPDVDPTGIKTLLSPQTIGMIFRRQFDRMKLTDALTQQFPRLRFDIRPYDWPPTWNHAGSPRSTP